MGNNSLSPRVVLLTSEWLLLTYCQAFSAVSSTGEGLEEKGWGWGDGGTFLESLGAVLCLAQEKPAK